MTTPPTIMTRWTATALFFLILSTACAFQRPRPLILNHGLLHASATVAAPGETVEEVFANVRDLISSELGLGNYEQTPLTMQGVRGSVETWDSNMDANVAWLSSLTMSGEGEGHFFASLQAFVGPKTDVPHFVARCRSLQKTTTESSSPRVALYLDFLPRLDAAYDAPRLEDGSGDYAPPDSREGFAAAGVRRQYAEEFFTADAEAWAAAVTTGADVQPPPCPEPKDCACITATAATAAVPSLPSMFHDSYCSPSSHALGLSPCLLFLSSRRGDLAPRRVHRSHRGPFAAGALSARHRRGPASLRRGGGRGGAAVDRLDGDEERGRESSLGVAGRLAHEPHDLRARLPSTQPDLRRRRSPLLCLPLYCWGWWWWWW